MQAQSFFPAPVCSVHVAPLSLEVYIYPKSLTQAASFVPSDDDVMELQDLFPDPVCSIHVAPLSFDVYK